MASGLNDVSPSRRNIIMINLQIVSGPAPSRSRRRAREVEVRKKGDERNDCLGIRCGPVAMHRAVRDPPTIPLALILERL